MHDFASANEPVFLLNAVLMIPNIVIRPSLEDTQEALVIAGKNITGVAKGVAQWTGGKPIKVTPPYPFPFPSLPTSVFQCSPSDVFNNCMNYIALMVVSFSFCILKYSSRYYFCIFLVVCDFLTNTTFLSLIVVLSVFCFLKFSCVNHLKSKLSSAVC